MAIEAGDEEADYESDPDESVLPLAMRRREASDDEEGDDEGERREKRSVPRAGIGSDEELDGQGGAPVYDDDESEVEEEEEEEGEEVEEEEEIEEEQVEEFEVTQAVVVAESGGEALLGSGGKSRVLEEEKRESEPFAVPTAGAFYMHDDRFRDNGGGRHR